MTFKRKNTIKFFDNFSLALSPKLNYYLDGIAKQRVLFINDKTESFTVSFEESMTDFPKITTESNVSYESCKDGKCICLQRKKDGKIDCAFFCIEIKDKDGRKYKLYGQMVVYTDYKWTDGIEPLLLELLDGIRLANNCIHSSENCV